MSQSSPAAGSTAAFSTDRGGCVRRCRLGLAGAAIALVVLPLLPTPAPAAPPTTGAVDQAAFAASPLADDELAGLSGGFSVGGFDLAVGIVSRSVLGQADGTGERLEVVSRYSVPGVGRLAHDGTTIGTLPASGDGTATGVPAGTGILISTLGTGAAVDFGATRLTHRLLDAFVENSDVNRAITRQLDINLKVGGLARRIDTARAARSLRPAVEAQILYGRR